MNNSINKLFKQKNGCKLSIFFTAGFPDLNDTSRIVEALSTTNVDFIEIGIPYSDPLADGTTIQVANQIALQNGMHILLLLEQLQHIRSITQVPILLMGYFNPILQFGILAFLKACKEIGIDGLIIPDLPMEYYIKYYKSDFERFNVSFIPLITPQTTVDRILFLDQHTDGFLYVVATNGITGMSANLQHQHDYLSTLNTLQLKNPKVLGFGIQTPHDITLAANSVEGVIVGSAFIRHLQQQPDLQGIASFIKKLHP